MHIGNAAVSRAVTCWRTPYQNLGITYRLFPVATAERRSGFRMLQSQTRHPRTGRGEPAGSAPQHWRRVRAADRRLRAPLGTGITNGAEHPAVLGREGIGRCGWERRPLKVQGRRLRNRLRPRDLTGLRLLKGGDTRHERIYVQSEPRRCGARAGCGRKRCAPSRFYNPWSTRHR